MTAFVLILAALFGMPVLGVLAAMAVFGEWFPLFCGLALLGYFALCLADNVVRERLEG